jgi:organic radical activating enzyme
VTPGVDYKAALKRILALAPKHIWLGGGEPTIVPELPAIVRELKQRLPVHLGLSTNLTRAPVAAAILPYIDDFIVSLDTASRDVSRLLRGVDPDAILATLRDLLREKYDKGYPANFSVVSVVVRESIAGDGIEQLSRRLSEIDPDITQIFSPVFPAQHPDSILTDVEAMHNFFGIVERLKAGNRKIVIDFPVQSGGNEFVRENRLCYRRYFRVRLFEDQEFSTSCPPAALDNAVCDTPCNSAGFVDDIIFARDEEKLKRSQLRNKLTAEEVIRLKEFHRTCIKESYPESIYRILSEKA